VTTKGTISSVVLRQGRRCARCHEHLCLVHAWALLGKHTVVVCESCFVDVPGTITALPGLR
jgi:predicted  nucleic acid-binding Zn-ribbon protein